MELRQVGDNKQSAELKKDEVFNQNNSHKTRKMVAEHHVGLLTIFFHLVYSRFVLFLLLYFVCILVDSFEDRLRYLLLPPLRHDQREVFVQLLVCL